MAINCQDCPKYMKCRQLCDEAEAYVNQDDTSHWRNVSFTMQIEKMEERKMPGMLTCEAILQNYFIDRMKQSEIAEMYNVSRPYVCKVVKKYTTIIKQNIKKSVKNG